jgi:hypothetical protein
MILGPSNLGHLVQRKKEYVGRQILTLLAGILLSVLGAAAGGHLIYHFSTESSQAGPALARYVVGPVIAVLVGVCVGILAKSHPGILACLSLLPSSIVVVAFRKLSLTKVCS